MSHLLEHTLCNPVLRRELTGGLRSPRLRWILLLYLLVPFAAIASVWPTNLSFYGGSWEALRVWRQFLSSQVFLICLLIPVFAAYSVSNEFEGRTADFLWTSLITPRWIVFSKLIAVALIGAALLTASLPALSLIFFLGGVGVREMMNGFLFLVAATFCATAVSVYESAACRKGHRSLFYSYVVISLLAILIGMAAPAHGFGVLFDLATVLPLAGTLYFAGLTWKIAGRPLPEPVSQAELAAVHGRRLRRDDSAAVRRPRRDPYIHRFPFPDGANVMGLQELRMHPLHPYRHSVLAVIAVPFLLVLVMGGIEAYSRLHTAFWSTNLFIAGLWVALTHAVSMTMEQESGVLKDLRLSTIRSRDFLHGKWLASLRARWLWMLAGAAVLAIVHSVESPWPGSFLVVPLLWIATVELTGLLSFAVSSICRRTMTAVALSLGSALLVWSISLGGFDVVENILSLQYFNSSLDAGLILLSTLAGPGALFYWLARLGVRSKWGEES